MDKNYLGKEVYQAQMDELRNNHRSWKKERQEQKTPFFMVYKDFMDLYLKDISAGSLKLYLYLGFHVNSFTGECWVSTEKIAEFFGNDPRSVRKWISELETLGLIKRIQMGFKRVSNTFLLPYWKAIESIESESESTIETNEENTHIPEDKL